MRSLKDGTEPEQNIKLNIYQLNNIDLKLLYKTFSTNVTSKD